MASYVFNNTIQDPHKKFHDAAVEFGEEPLLQLPSGRILSLTQGYFPLLVNFTFEDKAAKGLRKRGPNAKVEPPVYYSALETVRDNKTTFLCAAAGGGKTVFAKYLCLMLATGGLKKRRLVPCNDLGAEKEEWWDENTVPWYFEINSISCLEVAVQDAVPRLLEIPCGQSAESKPSILVIIDQIERACSGASDLLAILVARLEDRTDVRLLVLGDNEICQRWHLPANLARYELLPLSIAQRRQVIDTLGAHTTTHGRSIGLGAAAALPALFALALESASSEDTAEDLLDVWLRKTKSRDEADQLCAWAFSSISKPHYTGELLEKTAASNISLHLSPNPRTVRHLLAARHLSYLPAQVAIDLFHQEPIRWGPVIRHQLARLRGTAEHRMLIEGLLQDDGLQAERGALLVAEDSYIDLNNFRERVIAHMLRIIHGAEWAIRDRVQAGRILSRLGDPRDLEALARVNTGTVEMGSRSHPNSHPVTRQLVESFQIGVHPVVNSQYLAFVEETGRHWHSVDGRATEKRNAPATDLNWHDARAYCSFLTHGWRKSGRINAHETVRLPTELEWERASRGDVSVGEDDRKVWPWGTTWRNDAANSEESGLNTTCAVGLFPGGQSPFGCHDMAGQVWEWCSTLWGQDMATPSFQYPYSSNDGREKAEAGEMVRRVLRGGCFSSGAAKISCSYRGSLEPAGFWRGNGFRIVVARDPVPTSG